MGTPVCEIVVMEHEAGIITIVEEFFKQQVIDERFVSNSL
jgi:hypothetical protein